MDIRVLLREALLKEELPSQDDLEPDYDENPEENPEVSGYKNIYPENPEENPEPEAPTKMKQRDPGIGDVSPKISGKPVGTKRPRPIINASQQPTIENIKAIIDNNYRVRILYKGAKEESAAWRSVDIYTLGESQSGKDLIRAYQAFGHTTTAIAKWKLFRLDRIEEIQLTGYHYGYDAQKQIPPDKGQDGRYKLNGDGTMDNTKTIINKKNIKVT